MSFGVLARAVAAIVLAAGCELQNPAPYLGPADAESIDTATADVLTAPDGGEATDVAPMDAIDVADVGDAATPDDVAIDASEDAPSFDDAQDAALDAGADVLLLDVAPPDAGIDVPADVPIDLPTDVPMNVATDVPTDLPVDHPVVDVCTPTCAGAMCGVSNGCGGTCTAGSGCTTTEIFTVAYSDFDSTVMCDASSRSTIRCDAAADRWCRTHGWQAGFGPLDTGAAGGAVQVVCLAAPTAILNPSLATLTAAQPGCTQANQYSTYCMSACDGYCVRLGGYACGFGLVEWVLTSTSPSPCVCMSSTYAAAVNVTVAQMMTAGCSDPLARTNACRVAAHNLCVARGWVSGIGALEDGSGEVTLGCVR